MSRAFKSSLAGVAVTLLAWNGPWVWPAWPAFAVLYLIRGFHLSYGARALITMCLITLNIAVWGAAAYAAISAASLLRARRGRATPPL